MKKITFLLCLTLVVSYVFAQNNGTATSATTPLQVSSLPAGNNLSPGVADPLLIGIDKAQLELKEVSVSKFEDDGAWQGYMLPDDGYITLRRFEGSPSEKRQLAGEATAKVNENDRYVLGVKIEHIHRAVTSFSIFPLQPIAIPGIVKTVSVWVAGRSVRHNLYALLEDQFGNRAKIFLGDLGFSGWRRLTAPVPPSLRQSDLRFASKSGLIFKSFLVETDPVESYGSYYMYIDDLRAVTDLYDENRRDPDELVDTSW